MSTLDRLKGCAYGQAIGDALGLGAEFMTRAEVEKRYPEGLTDYSQIVQTSHTSRWRPFDHFVIDDYTMGYTLNTLFVALWAYWHAPTSEYGLLTVVNAGGDADTNGAVAASLLGAKFGFPSIPSGLITGLLHCSKIDEVVECLFKNCATIHNNFK
ncbi:MAG: ADP-ribosylglycohydrolase family protein [Bacteroidales bacterium]|nr:ADP-ribosylglycohydrolase family protein [Bacteroidales bacterium]